MGSRRNTAFVAIALWVGCACVAGAEDVAVVNGERISRADFGAALVRSLGPATLESFVDRMLVEQEARRRGMSVTDDELAARKALELRLLERAVLDNSRMGADEFKAATESYGWKPEALRQELEAGVSPEALRSKLLAEKIVAPLIDLSDGALRAYFERTRGKRYSAACVAVRTRAEAAALMDALGKDPELWTQAVLQQSLDRASVPYKGRIGPVPEGSDLGKALSRLAPGQMDLHQGEDLWYVLRLIAVVPPAAEDFEQVKDQIRAEVLAFEARGLFDVLLAELNRNACIVANLSPEPQIRALLGADVAAYVNGEALSASDMGECLIAEFGRAMLEPYVERTLIMQEARRKGLSVTDEELSERLRRIGEQLYEVQASQRDMTPQELTQALAEENADQDQFKQELVTESAAPEDVRATLLAEKLVADNVRVEDSDIEAAYRDLYGERLLVKELVADDAVAAQRMYRRVSQGASFDLLAMTEPSGPGVWMDFGNVTYVTASDPYYPHARDLQEGEISGVFEVDGKYRIIKLLKRYPPSEPPPMASVRDSLAQEAFARKARQSIWALLFKLKAEANIETELD